MLKDPHKPRAIIGILFGLLFLSAGTVATHYVWKPDQGHQWVVLIIPGLLLTGWGSAHLAQHRGYSSVIGYALAIIGLAAVGFAATSESSVAIGFGCLLAIVLPVAVLFALPRRPWFLSK